VVARLLCRGWDVSHWICRCWQQWHRSSPCGSNFLGCFAILVAPTTSHCFHTLSKILHHHKLGKNPERDLFATHQGTYNMQ
jgi:hypothetical protein